MDKFEQRYSEKETNDSHNSWYQNTIHRAFVMFKECPSTQQHMFWMNRLYHRRDAIHLIVNDNS